MSYLLTAACTEDGGNLGDINETRDAGPRGFGPVVIDAATAFTSMSMTQGPSFGDPGLAPSKRCVRRSRASAPAPEAANPYGFCPGASS